MRDATTAVRPPLVIGCGALARELVDLTRRAGLPAMDLTCLPASLHNRPERIPGAVAARIRRARAEGYDRIFVAYADCGTGGRLDRVLEAEGVARLEGAHCYEVYAGRAAFAALSDAEPGTFYLTDFLVRNFDRLVVRGLGLDRHPELLPLYFGNYRRLVYLAQTEDPELTGRAAAAARRLGLTFERRSSGLGELATAVRAFASARPASASVRPASASVGPASDERSRRPSAARARVRVPNQRRMQDSGQPVVNAVAHLRRMTDADHPPLSPVRNVHRMQAAAPARHRMQHRDRRATTVAPYRHRMQHRDRRPASAASAASDASPASAP